MSGVDKKVKLIVAMDTNYCIGKDNKLPWVLQDDLKRFKRLTDGCTVIMGSNTMRSLGKPLSGRENIVVTSKDQVLEGFIKSSSLEEALEIAKSSNSENIWVIGGASIYRQALDSDYVDEMYVTRVVTIVDKGDTFLDVFNLYNWELIKFDVRYKDEYNEHNYTYCIYGKVNC